LNEHQIKGAAQFIAQIDEKAGLVTGPGGLQRRTQTPETARSQAARWETRFWELLKAALLAWLAAQ